MNKITAIFLFIITVISTVSINAALDTRIRFARGRTSASVSGTVSSGGRVCYVAGAKEGQTLTATLSSRTGKAQILESGDTSYNLTVEYSGDQSICVDNLGGSTRYTLTVSIN
jgi:hypothetical protein